MSRQRLIPAPACAPAAAHPARRRAARTRQRGIATVLIVLLTGLGLTAGVLGTVSYVRDLQEQDRTAHAQTQAQMKAWTGAEVVQQYLGQLDGTALAALLDQTASRQQPLELQMQGTGVEGVIAARIVGIDKDAGTITARITGVGAPGTRAEARSVLEVVYGAEAGSEPQPPTMPRASAVFRGDLSISGGTTSFSNNEGASGYQKIAVDGKLTIASASQAKISGCTKGDINMSGGGIDDNAMLTSQNGTITIGSISMPKNATLWGSGLNIANSGSGSFIALKAGAYRARVMVGNVVAGTANVGGVLIDVPSGSPLPWITGTVKPWPTGRQLITLADGGEYLLDMAKASIDAATGQVTVANLAEAVEKVNGQGADYFPSSFRLVSTGISGGDLTLYQTKAAETWGHVLTFQPGGGAEFAVVKANGSLEIKRRNDKVAELRSGGSLYLREAQYTEHQWWTEKDGFPNLKGQIAGSVIMKNGAVLPDTAKAKQELQGQGFEVKQNTIDTETNKSLTTGLPGEVFCDTRVHAFDAAAYRSQANYIFDFDSDGKPRLTIQNVKLRPGGGASEVSIDKANIDLKTVDPVSGTKPGDMKLRLIQGKKFLGCSNQAPDEQYADALACLRSATPQSGWNLSGITKFPPGIALFIGPVTIDGVAGSQGALYNTILATGDVTLTGSGHGPLIAPNFASPVDKMCGGDFYPSNLCESASKLKTYNYQGPDGTAKTITGMPLANIAIGTNASLAGNSWDGNNGIQGHVIVGKGFTTSGATISIKGTITVGVNEPGNTTLQQGGFQIDTTNMSLDQQYMPVPGGGSAAAPGGVRLKWSRYL